MTNTFMRPVTRDLASHGLDDPRGIWLDSGTELEAEKVF